MPISPETEDLSVSCKLTPRTWRSPMFILKSTVSRFIRISSTDRFVHYILSVSFNSVSVHAKNNSSGNFATVIAPLCYGFITKYDGVIANRFDSCLASLPRCLVSIPWWNFEPPSTRQSPLICQCKNLSSFFSFLRPLQQRVNRGSNADKLP